jgi:type I restriction enzyme S subunit
LTSNGSWQKIRFDEICKNISDRIDDPKQAKTDYYVGLEHLDSEDPKISRHGSPQDVGATKLKFKTGQILFGKRRWYLRKLAVAEREGICSAHMMVLESISDKIKKEFLSILMQGDDFFEKALSVSAGSLSPTIKWKDMASLEFLIPSIQQQENILSVMQKIDETISNAQKLLEKTKNYMVSRRELLLTRGIGHVKFKKVPWLYGKTIEIPEAWEIKKIKDLGTVVTGNTPSTSVKDYYGNEFLWATPPDLDQSMYVTNTHTKLSKKGYHQTRRLPSNTIMISCIGEIGKISLTKNEMSTNQQINSLICINDDPEFIYFLLIHNSENLQNKANKSVIPILTKSDFEDIILAIPPLPEQQKITSILSNINEQITQQQSHLTYLKVLRKSILNSKLTKEKYN